MTESTPPATAQPSPARPLDGIRVLEMGQLLAGPFAGTLLAYYGAEVIKIEPPGKGDPIRGWRLMDGDTSLWWYTLARNKKCITLDLRRARGQALARDLAARADVLLENFRPGTLERWGLGPADLHPRNPELIFARVSGFGQTGPYAEKPGYASVGEGIGGLRHLTGVAGQPPVRSNLSLGDTLAGLHTAFGVVLALLGRLRQRAPAGGVGQTVDVAIYEAIFNLLEAVVPEHDRCGVVRQPSGSTVTGIVPTNTYPCRDGRYVIIGGSGDSIYRRLMRAAGRDDLADDPRLADNEGRVRHQEEIDGAIAAWTRTLDAEAVLRRLDRARVAAGPIYSVADMVQDPHFQARGLFEQVEAGGRPLTVPGIVPKLSQTPGRTEWAGPPLGAHNDEIFRGLLGLGEQTLATLRADGVIG